jgi:hypothetical protein
MVKFFTDHRRRKRLLNCRNWGLIEGVHLDEDGGDEFTAAGSDGSSESSGSSGGGWRQRGQQEDSTAEALDRDERPQTDQRQQQGSYPAGQVAAAAGGRGGCAKQHASSAAAAPAASRTLQSVPPQLQEPEGRQRRRSWLLRLWGRCLRPGLGSGDEDEMGTGGAGGSAAGGGGGVGDEGLCINGVRPVAGSLVFTVRVQDKAKPPADGGVIKAYRWVDGSAGGGLGDRGLRACG